MLHTGRHPGKSMYECRFCDGGLEAFATNLATEYKAHLASVHPDRFRSVAAAASFVAGIYDKAKDQADRVLPYQPRARSACTYRIQCTRSHGTNCPPFSCVSRRTRQRETSETAGVAVAFGLPPALEEDLPTDLATSLEPQNVSDLEPH